MQLSYWNAYTRQLPFTWSGIDNSGQKIDKASSIIRVKGHHHTTSFIQWLYQISQENPDHIFLIFSNDVRNFTEYSIPSNVIPGLQLDSKLNNISAIKEFMDIDLDGGQRAISYYCNKIVGYVPKVDWIFLSGASEYCIEKTIDNCHRLDIPVYVETLFYRPHLPEKLCVRECPKQVFDNMLTLVDYLQMHNYPEGIIAEPVSISGSVIDGIDIASDINISIMEVPSYV